LRSHLQRVEIEILFVLPHLQFNRGTAVLAELKNPDLRPLVGQNARKRPPVRRHQMDDRHFPVIGDLKAPGNDAGAPESPLLLLIRHKLRSYGVRQRPGPCQMDQTNQPVITLRRVYGVLLPE
jgi:hypothetical protein